MTVASPLSPLSRLPEHFANAPLLAFIVGWAALYGPVYAEFAVTVWQKDENAHAPFLMAACLGTAMATMARKEFIYRANAAEFKVGALSLVVSLVIFLLGRASETIIVVSASQMAVAASSALMVFGSHGVRALWFPLVLSFYLVVWPGWAIDALTAPLKRFISEIVSDWLFMAGLPVAHSGAVISAGQYQLLVADACAGLNSLIALTSVGALYLYAVNRVSIAANITVALLIIPIAILANIIRVTVLVLITYYMGYDAGQSFLHEGAGLLMFAIALACVFAVDAAIQSGRERVS